MRDKHAKDKMMKEKTSLTTQMRFWHLPEHSELCLVKTMIQLILAYSSAHPHVASRTQAAVPNNAKQTTVIRHRLEILIYREQNSKLRLNVCLINTRLMEVACKISEELENQEEIKYDPVKELYSNKYKAASNK